MQRFEISRALFRAKQVGEKRGKIQNPEKVLALTVVVVYFSLY